MPSKASDPSSQHQKARKKPASTQPLSSMGKSSASTARPRLLGVFIDRSLCMRKHVDVVVERVRKMLKRLNAISNSEWGWRKYDLKKVYLSQFKTVIDYSGSAWQPWLSESQVLRLERVQREALRLITRQSKTSPVDCMRLELGLPSIRASIKANCMKSHEKALMLPLDHPRRICLDQEPVVRLERRTNCRTTGLRLLENLPPEANKRRPFSFYAVSPWEQDLGPVTIFKDLPGIKSKHDKPEDILAAAITRINSLDSELKIYTDGSAAEGTLEGGAAAVITIGPAERPVQIGTPVMIKGSYLTCSYAEEWTALEGAIEWMERHCTSSVTVVTDSQSLCEALLGIDPELDNLRKRLRDRPHHTLSPSNGSLGIVASQEMRWRTKRQRQHQRWKAFSRSFTTPAYAAGSTTSAKTFHQYTQERGWCTRRFQEKERWK